MIDSPVSQAGPVKDCQGLQGWGELGPAEPLPGPPADSRPGYLQLHLVSQSALDKGLRGITDILNILGLA